MARKSEPAAAATLDDIQSAADRLGDWIRERLVPLSIGVATLLLLAGGIRMFVSSREAREVDGSTALALARLEYLRQMGAPPGSIEVPELANPEAAARIREAFREQLAALADEYPGTVAAAIALMESGRLLSESGDAEAAAALWDELLAEGLPNPGLRGLVLQRSAQALEDQGRWEEAAARHEEAAALEGFPLRGWALADAARCRALAGDREGARALYVRLETVDPELRLPEHQRVEARELGLTTGTP